MTLKHRHKTAKIAKNDSKMSLNCDSDEEKRKYNGYIPTGT